MIKVPAALAINTFLPQLAKALSKEDNGRRGLTAIRVEYGAKTKTLTLVATDAHILNAMEIAEDSSYFPLFKPLIDNKVEYVEILKKGKELTIVPVFQNDPPIYPDWRSVLPKLDKKDLECFEGTMLTYQALYKVARRGVCLQPKLLDNSILASKDSIGGKFYVNANDKLVFVINDIGSEKKYSLIMGIRVEEEEAPKEAPQEAQNATEQAQEARTEPQAATEPVLKSFRTETETEPDAGLQHRLDVHAEGEAAAALDAVEETETDDDDFCYLSMAG